MKMNKLILTGALACLAGLSAVAAEKPVFTVGMLTDTHVRTEKKTCARTKAAFELFREQKVDLVFHTGDLADYYCPEGWRNWRETIEEVFPDAATRPRVLYALAGHDRNGAPGEKWVEKCRGAYLEMLKTFGSDQKICEAVEFRGYTIITTSEDLWNRGEIEGLIRAACLRHPGKPVFVIDHEPGYDTTTGSVLWGRRAARELYDKYPQVVHIGGHSHNSIRSERNIWQGGHTAVDLACLISWNGQQDGLPSKSAQEAGVTLMDVYPDRLVFRRYDLLNNNVEIRPDERWTVPLPFDPKTAPYREEARTARDTAPTLEGAVKAVAQPERAFRAVFPAGRHHHGIWRYECELQRAEADGSWRALARLRPFGDFYLPEEQRAAEVAVPFARGYFAEGGRYRFAVRAQAFSSLRSEPAYSDAFALPPDPDLTTVWCDGEVRSLVDKGSYRCEIPLPDEVNRLPKGTKLVLSAEFRTQAAQCSLMPVGKCGKFPQGRCYAWSSPPEDAETPLRVSFDLTKSEDDEKLFLARQTGQAVRIDVTNLRVLAVKRK